MVSRTSRSRSMARRWRASPAGSSRRGRRSSSRHSATCATAPETRVPCGSRSTGSTSAPWAAMAPSSNGASQAQEDRGDMASDSSFDVVSDFDQQELVNALDQARREITTRYDFKGSKVAFELGKEAIVLTADDEYRAGAAKDLHESKAVRRGLSLKIYDWGKVERAGRSTVRQETKPRRVLMGEQAKEFSKLIR